MFDMRQAIEQRIRVRAHLLGAQEAPPPRPHRRALAAGELDRARDALERRVDAAGEDGFPASDPPLYVGMTGPRPTAIRNRTEPASASKEEEEVVGHMDIWRTEPSGGLATEACGLRLAVRPPEKPGGMVRFLVVRRNDDEHAQGILVSGTEGDVRAAMKAAVRAAERILARPFRFD